MNVNTKNDDTGVVEGDFRSCALAWDRGDAVLSTVTLLPVKYAKIGKKIQLKENNEWKPWVVISASEHIITNPVDPKVLIKAHRRGTGDSMPRKTSK